MKILQYHFGIEHLVSFYAEKPVIRSTDNRTDDPSHSRSRETPFQKRYYLHSGWLSVSQKFFALRDMKFIRW